MICSYIIALVFLICYILVCISKNIKERLDQVSFKIKKMFFFTVDWLVILPVCATVASFCFAFLFTFAQVDGDSMLPNIENESTVFVSYLDKVDRFDVVVAYINSSDYVNVGVNTSEYYIKRVKRDKQAREEYFNKCKKDFDINDLTMLDIIRRGIEHGDSFI
jgi:hypothetical protein